MKIKYNDFFTESVIEKIDNKIKKLSKEAIAVLGLGNITEEVDFSKDQVQKIMEFIVNKEIFTREENIKYFWMAINDINLTKINELKNNIDGKEYAEILITSLLLNSIIRNDKVIKFLLTETEISQYPTLKAKIIPNFLCIDNKSELNEEIIELLSIDNEAIFRKELSYFLWNSNIPDRLFIKSFENISDINKPLIREVSYDQGQTFQDEEYTLLSRVIYSKRFELAKYLANKGAKILPDEVHSLLWNIDISDELLISGINISDISKPLIRKVSYDQGQTFSNEEYSLLEEAIQSNRLELVQHLANNGADVNFADNTRKLYVTAYYKGISFFEALVSSNKLEKDLDMNNYIVDLGNQISLSLSNLYDVIKWKNNFNASLTSDFEKLDEWLNDGKMHSVKSLFNAFQKFSNIKVNYLEDRSPTFKQVQEKYGKEIIKQKTNEINESILKIIF
ncbi:hypothetical protein A1I_06905 [Rickettsia bellii OSU 85-389]|uniref:hypothetical protein n=1 Tax=Rickettsia bellii TaxID=33990 RepID=UPI0000DB1063|nr:hypothetical protein [Rickettsia bellii]ABV79691.1 hypothetical protein A1I_06905 [Rickettsia bellii OSU 85-389]